MNACFVRSSVVLAVLFEGAVAGAYPSSKLVYIRGEGSEQCADEAAVRREVKDRLGYDPFFPTADRTIIAEIGRDIRGLRATVRLIDDHGIARGARTLRSASRECSEL
ncbi:MAG TPA: hypothetical protein VJT73_16695, partial [Polyangiaceae bacterium]|nr:hypothetical protein [Polyangiaceae bacterium]